MGAPPSVDGGMVRRVAGFLREAADTHILPELTSGGRAPAAVKAGGGLVTQVDGAVQAALQQNLAEAYPGIGLLGEEMPPAEHRRLVAEAESGLWCLDPLDGTSNFASGIPIFGISLALLVEGEPALGVVLDPLRDELFTAIRGQGAWLDDEPIGVQAGRSLRRSVGIVDFKRLDPGIARRLAGEQPFHCQRNFGSSVLEWCWLACGRVDFYLHGGQNLWDFAAGSLIAAEAGADVATLEGDRLFGGDILRRSVLAVAERNLRKELTPFLSGAEGPAAEGRD